ncbi:alpha/beta fold hydrolase [Halobacillus sp. A5]|uniref:alpha/beta hydrolase n=1 Tax=Halobacillus sp. A5 TaxID=2880263 RepID=UPI0020A62432|nr:alpha/beta fold hydrolase [Halobacillus sp. A5]
MKKEWKQYAARDFSTLFYLHYNNGNSQRALIMVHGITVEVKHHEEMAKVYKAGGDIFLPLLRGYDSQHAKGKLDYIGQYDDDLFDFIHFIRKQGYQEIILAGHSMGCANLLRLIYKNEKAADGYVFFAPYFHPEIPVYQEDVNEHFKPETEVDYKVFSKKAAALALLQKLGIQRFNNQTVAIVPDEFSEGDLVHLSFKLMFSRFLEPFPGQMSMIKKFITFIGEKDEFIVPSKLQRWHRDTFLQDVLIIPGEDHNHLLHNEIVHKKLEEVL